MSEIKERLDKVRALIQESEFLEGKGLSNEVNIRIFCYEPENEMVVRHFVNQLETDQFLDCHLIVCNLYKIFLSICDDMDITDAIPDMEEADGSAYLLEQLNSAIGNGEFIEFFHSILYLLFQFSIYFIIICFHFFFMFYLTVSIKTILFWFCRTVVCQMVFS